MPTELLQIYKKVLTIAELCLVQPCQTCVLQTDEEIITQIKNSLNTISMKIESMKEVQQDYKKLEESIQKKENDIRKHIGIQQQLKLYSESLEQQLDQSEHARSEFIQKTRKMLSDLKRNNHFLHQQNIQLKSQISFAFEDDKTRKKAYCIDVDLKKHMRTQSSKDYFQKTPSRNKFTNSSTKKIDLVRQQFKQLLSSVQRKQQIQKKIKQLNQKKTIIDKNNSSYHDLYSKNGDKSYKKQAIRSSLRKNNNSKKSCNDDDTIYQKMHHKTRSVNRDY